MSAKASPSAKDEWLSVQTLEQASRAILSDRTEFQLSPEQWEVFCERLDAPPQAIPALRRLFSEAERYDG